MSLLCTLRRFEASTTSCGTSAQPGAVMEGSVDPSVVIALTSKELMEGIELQETRDLNYTKAWSGAEASYEQEHVPGAKRRRKMPMRSVGGPDAPHSPADAPGHYMNTGVFMVNTM